MITEGKELTASEGDRSICGPYLLVGPGVGQSNPFDCLAGEARRAGVAAEPGAGVDALDLGEAGVCVALRTRGRVSVRRARAGPAARRAGRDPAIALLF